MDRSKIDANVHEVLGKTAELLKSLSEDLKDTSAAIPNLELNVASCEAYATKAGFALWLLIWWSIVSYKFVFPEPHSLPPSF